MNAPLRPEVLLPLCAAAPPPQASLPLATEGVQRYVWDGRWGAMLIEVTGDDVYVNGQRVVPHVGSSIAAVPAWLKAPGG